MKTIEEKAKAYDEAFERARAIRFGNPQSGTANVVCEEIFPELRESEDEKNWKAVMEYIKDDALRSWLEKQKEDKETYFDGYLGYLKGYNKGQLNPIEKQKEQKSLSPEDKIKHPLYVEGFEAGKEVGRQCEKVFGEQKPAGWSKEEENVYNGLISQLERTANKDDIHEVAKVNAYKVWLKHHYCQTLMPTEWSEKDEETIGSLINYFEGDALDCSAEEMIQRLKSLRPSWKPSELEKGALRTAIHILTEERNFPKATEQLQNILDAFEGKEPRKDWRPSEEQMLWLKCVVDATQGEAHEPLRSLYYNLLDRK